MLPNINPTTTEAWKELEAYFAEIEGVQMKDMFAKDASRFEKYSLEFEAILVDYSKNRIDEKVMHLLMQLADECGLKEAIVSEFSGEKINKIILPGNKGSNRKEKAYNAKIEERFFFPSEQEKAQVIEAHYKNSAEENNVKGQLLFPYPVHLLFCSQHNRFP